MDTATLQPKAGGLAAKTFLGGGVEAFEAIGRLQLHTLLRFGLYPGSRVLDLGCGCLRGGDWLIHFLFFIARSIWIHASRQQIMKMLDVFLALREEDSVFLTSFLPAAAGEGDTSPEWVGRSHESEEPGMVRHDRHWIEEVCRKLFSRATKRGRSE